MEAGRKPSDRPVRRRSGIVRRVQAGTALLLALSWVSLAAADIYRWVDDQGTIHFTDDLSNIPAAARKTTILQQRGAPESGGSLSIVGAPPLPPAEDRGADSSLPAPESGDVESEREALLSRIEQLEAKIAAKEQHIQAVDDKRSLAMNPLRNRVVEPSDFDLYNKYQDELPGDREELRALQEELSSLR